MRTDVLQAIAICLHGNAYLADPQADRACEMLGSNTLFKSVFEIAFERRPIGSRTIVTLGNSVAPWLRRVRAEDVQQLRLFLTKIPCPMDKLPDGPWGIVTDGDSGTEIWQPQWKGRLVRYDEPPSWKVTYAADRFLRWSMSDPPAPTKVLRSLGQSWADLQDIAHRLGNAEIVDLCDRCGQLQQQGSVACPGYPDMIPATLDAESTQVSAAAVRAIICIGGTAWTNALRQREAAEFCLATRQLWRTSLSCFESVAHKGVWSKATQLPEAS